MAELWERTRNEDPTQAFDEFCRIFVPEFPFLEYGQFKANERDSRRTRGIAVAIYLLVGGAAIAFIEVTIRAFSDVSLQDSIANTTGQLLSLLLALFGILAFSYDIFRNRRKKTKKRKTISAIADRVFAMIVENNEEMERRQAEEQQAGFAQGPQSGEYLV
jgi:dolichol kinase